MGVEEECYHSLISRAGNMRFFVERKGTSNSLPFFLLFQRETFLAPAFAFGFRNEIAFVHIPGGSWHAIKTAPIMLKGRMFKFQFKQSAQRIIGMKACSAMFWKTINHIHVLMYNSKLLKMFFIFSVIYQNTL